MDIDPFPDLTVRAPSMNLQYDRYRSDPLADIADILLICYHQLYSPTPFSFSKTMCSNFLEVRFIASRGISDKSLYSCLS